MPSTSVILSPASLTALVIASRCNANWLLWGSVPISSLSSTPTIHTALDSSLSALRSAIRFASWLACRLEQRNGHVVRQLGKHYFHGHVALNHFGIRFHIHEIGQHAWPLFKFDHGQDIGRWHLDGAIERTIQDLKRVELAPAAALDPGQVFGMAMRAKHARIEVDLAAILTFGQHELAFFHAIPIRLRLRCNRLWNWTFGFHETPFTSAECRIAYSGQPGYSAMPRPIIQVVSMSERKSSSSGKLAPTASLSSQRQEHKTPGGAKYSGIVTLSSLVRWSHVSSAPWHWR